MISHLRLSNLSSNYFTSSNNLHSVFLATTPSLLPLTGHCLSYNAQVAVKYLEYACWSPLELEKKVPPIVAPLAHSSPDSSVAALAIFLYCEETGEIRVLWVSKFPGLEIAFCSCV